MLSCWASSEMTGRFSSRPDTAASLGDQDVSVSLDLEHRVQLADRLQRRFLGQERHHDPGAEMRQQFGLDVDHVAFASARHRVDVETRHQNCR